MELGSGVRIADLTFRGMTGVRACGHARLRIDFATHVREQPISRTVRLWDFSGELHVHEASGGMLHVARLAPASPTLRIESQPNSHSLTIGFEADLDRYRLEAIELARCGKDLDWTVHMAATTDENGTVRGISGHDDIRLNRGQWIDILKQIGYQDTLLIEVPLRPATRGPLAKALSHLNAAREAIQDGTYRDAVAKCRDAIEALKSIMGDDKEITFQNSRSHSKQQRLLLLAKALKQLPHAAKHEAPEDKAIEWERADAELLVCMTAALVRRYMPG